MHWMNDKAQKDHWSNLKCFSKALCKSCLTYQGQSQQLQLDYTAAAYIQKKVFGHQAKAGG